MVCIVDKLHGFAMPTLMLVFDSGTHVFQVHEKAELASVANK